MTLRRPLEPNRIPWLKFSYWSDYFFVCCIISIIWAVRESKKIEDQFWLDSTMAAWNCSKTALPTLSFDIQFSKFLIFLTALMMNMRQLTKKIIKALINFYFQRNFWRHAFFALNKLLHTTKSVLGQLKTCTQNNNFGLFGILRT